MSKFKKIPTPLDGLFIIEPTVFEDDRGFFTETYNKQEFDSIGIDTEFVQDNRSFSKKGVLRGMHFQTKYQQVKLVSVIRGAVFDVAVDLREESETYGKYYGIILSGENQRILYIPTDFAHGFLVLSEMADFVYKVSDFYHAEYDAGFVWNDKDIGIEWPLSEYEIDRPILSPKDERLPLFNELKDR